jgi:hypothetical protein
LDIKLLSHKEIDHEKWDDCILNAVNGSHYAMSWYLDIVSSVWKGLVWGDYEAVMPVPVRNKFGIPMIIQPFMTQQLGIFSSNELSQELTDRFYKQLKQKYPVIYNLSLHFKPANLQGLKLLPNIELHLDGNYSEISKNYSKNTKRNIAKAESYSLVLKENISNEESFDFYFRNLRFKYSRREQELFKTVVETSLKRDEGLWLSVSNEKGTVIALAFFLIFKNIITFLGSSSSDEGYEKYAVFFLFDKVIERFSGSNYVLDFEGSQTEGVARFYQGFGGQVTEYGQYSNRAFNIYLSLKKIIER